MSPPLNVDKVHLTSLQPAWMQSVAPWVCCDKTWCENWLYKANWSRINIQNRQSLWSIPALSDSPLGLQNMTFHHRHCNVRMRNSQIAGHAMSSNAN